MSNDHSVSSPHDRDFGIAVGLWGAALVTVFGYGLYAFIDQKLWYAVPFTSVGLAGLAYLTCHLKGRRLSPRAGVMAATLAVTWVLIGYQIWQAPAPTQITAATRAIEKKSLSPGEEQFRLDLRKFVLSPLDELKEKYLNVFLPLLRSQHDADMEFFGIELIQKGLYRDFEAASTIAKHDLNEIDSDGLQYAIVRVLGTYTQS